MQVGYFKTAWTDIKQSPGWMAKLALLTLVSFIPVFGWIVVFGYLFGWARDIAWKVPTPLPARIFGNEDGKLYSRGFFVLVIGVVFSLIPIAVRIIDALISGIGILGFNATSMLWQGRTPLLLSFVFGALKIFVDVATFSVSFAVLFFTVLFIYVGWMRASIYGRLSAGFQLKKIWSMLRLDFKGILHIFGMAVLANLILQGVVLVFLFVFGALILSTFVLMSIMFGGGGFSDTSIGIALLFMVCPTYLFLAVAAVFCLTFLDILIVMLVARALGYWTQQFDVASWRGQDDPMAFEIASASALRP